MKNLYSAILLRTLEIGAEQDISSPAHQVTFKMVKPSLILETSGALFESIIS